MFQSGTYNGTYTYKGQTHKVENWWGQRDHSWGIRAHGRCPMWMWLAIQLPEGMLGVWNWEYPNGARVYTDGCFAPSDGSDPIPVIGFEHDLQWQDENENETSYDRFGENVHGLGGVVHFTLQGGRKITVTAQGKWAQRYSDIERTPRAWPTPCYRYRAIVETFLYSPLKLQFFRTPLYLYIYIYRSVDPQGQS